MPQQNLNQVRVIDPILTQVVQGYKHSAYVGLNLFPQVPVKLSGGKVLEFGKEDFRLYNTRRAPGSDVKQVQYGHEGKPYALENHALAGKLPVEHQRDALESPGVDLSARAVRRTMRIIMHELEAQQASIATDAANYGASNKVALTGTGKWSDPASTPLQQITDYSEVVRQAIGMRPNTLILSAQAYAATRNNPQIQDRIKYTQRGVVTVDLLATLMDVPRVFVADAVVASGANDVFSDIWGNNAVLAYVPEVVEGMEEPSYGYTYGLEGHPLAEESYYERNNKSWMFPVAYERAPVLTGISAGFLIQGVA